MESTQTWRCKIQASADVGCSWLIVIASFFQQFVSLGLQHVYGLFYVEFLKEFEGTKPATIALVGSVAYGFTFVLAPFTALLCQRYGSRSAAFLGIIITGLGYFLTSFVDSVTTMFITYSIVVAIGSSLLYLSSIYILEEYFTKRLASSNGLALAGTGVGTLILMPVNQKLIVMFGWRKTMRMISAFIILLFLCSLVQFFVKAPKKLTKNEKYAQRSAKLFDKGILKNRAFVVWLSVMALVLFGFYIPYVHLVRHCQDFDIPRKDSSILVGYIAISETIGKVIFGLISDHPRVKRVFLLQYGLLMCGVATTLLPIMVSAESIAVYSWVYGFHDGCLVVHIALLSGDIVGREKITEATGLVYFSLGVAMAIGPPVAGMMYSMTGTYTPAFFMSGAFTIIGTCLLFLVPILLPRDIVQRWEHRSEAKEVLLTPIDTDKNDSVDKSDSSGTVLLNKNEGVEYEISSRSGSKRTIKTIKKAESQNRFSWMVDRYLSMEHLVDQNDCFLSKVYSKENLYRVSLPEECETIRETVV